MKKIIKSTITCTLLLLSCSTFAQEKYEDALAAFNQEKVGEAYVLLKNTLRDDPEHLPSKLLMGRILLIDGFPADAITEFEESIQLGADKNLALPYLSTAYLIQGDYDLVINLAEAHSVSQETKVKLKLNAANAYIRQGEPKQAEQEFQQVLNLTPNNFSAIAAYCDMLISVGELQQAEQILHNHRSQQNGSPILLHTFGRLQAAKGNLQNALSSYEKVNLLEPNNPLYMRSLASTYAELGKFDKANQVISQIEEQTPLDIQVRLLKARILALTKQQLEADEILKELSHELSLLDEKQRNERVQLSVITGIIAYINENFELASAELARYASERTPSPQIIGMLADSLLRVGYYKDAITALEKHQDVVLKDARVGVLTCELYIMIRRNFKCERLLPELLTKYPDNTKVKLIEPKLLMSKFQYQAAIDYIESNLNDNKEEPVTELKAILYGQIGDYENALIQAENLTTQWPDNLSYQIIHADIAVRLGQIDNASMIIEKALTLEPTHLGAQVVKARILFSQGDREAATRLLESVVKEKQDSLSALLLLGQIYTLEEKYELAIDRLLIAKALNTSSREPRELLVSLYRQTNDAKSALSEINQLLNLDRLNTDYMLQKADILISMRNYTDAASKLNVVYGAWSENAPELLRLSNIQKNALDFNGAEKSIKRAIELRPDWELGHAEHIKFLIEQSQQSNAEAALSTFAKKFGTGPNYLILKGDLAISQGNVGEAYSYYLKSHKAMPNFNMPLLKLYSIAQANAEFRGQFIKYVDSIVFTDQQPIIIKQILADTLLLDKQYDKAEALYTELLALDDLPQKPFVLNNMANIYALKDINKALEYSQQAVELNTNSAPLLDTYGWLLVSANEVEKGLDVLRRAYAVNSEDATIQYHIAATLEKLGRVEEAKQELLRNDLLKQSFPEQADAQALLERLP